MSEEKVREIGEIVNTNSISREDKVKELNKYNKADLVSYGESINLTKIKSLNKEPLIDKIIEATKPRDTKQQLVDFVSKVENQKRVVVLSEQFRSMYGRSWFSATQAYKGIQRLRAQSIERLREDLRNAKTQGEREEIQKEIDGFVVERADEYAKRLATINLFGVLKMKKIKGEPHYRVRQDKVAKLRKSIEEREEEEKKDDK